MLVADQDVVDDRLVDTAQIQSVVQIAAAAAIVYLFRSLRRFNQEGRARYVTRTIAEGQERLDSSP